MPGRPRLQCQAVPGSRDSPHVPGTGRRIPVLSVGGGRILPLTTQDITSSQGGHSLPGEEEQSSHGLAQVTLNMHTPEAIQPLSPHLGCLASHKHHECFFHLDASVYKKKGKGIWPEASFPGLIHLSQPSKGKSQEEFMPASLLCASQLSISPSNTQLVASTQPAGGLRRKNRGTASKSCISVPEIPLTWL